MEAALQAMQRLAAESAATDGLDETQFGPNQSIVPIQCQICGHQNRPGTRFCGMCGLPLEAKTADFAPRSEQSAIASSISSQSQPEGPHHYHHHYHHHYFAQNADHAGPSLPRAGTSEGLARDLARPRTPGSAQGMTRAEAAVRKVTQDWAVACNSRQLEDLVSTYGTDAMILRPNHPAVRGSTAIREFFFSALEAGLGEVELEILRVEVIGDVAYEAGRCKMLVPVAVSKRREERGKYLTVLARQSNGEWRIVVDCWSSDLSLTSSAEVEVGRVAPSTSPQRPPVPRKAT
jgi:uncharacterized protein (TIGR02246 family)